MSLSFCRQCWDCLGEAYLARGSFNSALRTFTMCVQVGIIGGRGFVKSGGSTWRCMCTALCQCVCVCVCVL